MNDKKLEETEEETEKNLPISVKSKNTFKDFLKICEAYNKELSEISNTNNPSLSKNDIIILDDLLDEIITYSTELLNLNFISSPKKLLEKGLDISHFLLEIFKKMSEEYNTKMKNNNKVNINIKNTLNEKMEYPLSLRLKLLKLNFKILFEKNKDYINAEKNLKEIIEIQAMIKTSNYNLASSKFLLAKIEYLLKHFEEAEKLALEAKNLFENSENKKNENNNINNDLEMEKNITQNLSNIFRFLAQICLLKDDYKNTATYYEHGYYLNLGRFGADNKDTIFFKKKLDLINEELNIYPSFQGFKVININNQSKNNNKQGNILYKGQTETFSFQIQTSLFSEPFNISLFIINKEGIYDTYSQDLLIGKISFDKKKLMKFLNIKGNNINTNNLFYTDENINLILINMKISNGCLVFQDKELKNCLINATCLVK